MASEGEGPPCGVLLATDGEPHSEAAAAWAMDIAASRCLPLTVVHVKDQYLRQFQSEIYAQGREEYLEHLETCLAGASLEITGRLSALAEARGLRCRVLILEGDPLPVLLAESRAGAYQLLVLGRKDLKGLAAWRSRSLPQKLAAAASHLPVLLVPG